MGKSHKDPLTSRIIFDQSSLCGLWSVWSLSEKWQTRGEELYPDQESENSKILLSLSNLIELSNAKIFI